MGKRQEKIDEQVSNAAMFWNWFVWWQIPQNWKSVKVEDLAGPMKVCWFA